MSAQNNPSAKKNSRSWLTVAGVIVLPLLLVATLVASVWQADQRNDQVKAAIVNLDEPVTLDGQYVPLGRQLAGKLASLDQAPGSDEEIINYDWSVTNPDDAAEGLKSGKYAAVVTIPENFSSAATSTADAAEAEQALVNIEVSPRASSVDPTFARTVVQAAIDTMNAELTETFLDNIFVGFSTMGEQFQTISDASSQLADGTGALADGVDGMNDGVKELADGVQQLDDNGSTLRDGVSQYVDGTVTLAEALSQLNDQIAQMPGLVKQLSDGADQTADGASELAGGAKELADGADALADGVDQTGAGAKQFADQLGEAAGGAKQLAEGASVNAAGVQAFMTGLQAYRDGLEAARKAATCPEDVAEGEACDAYKKGYTAGIDTALQVLDSAGLIENGDKLSQGAKDLSDGVSGLSGGLDQAATGAKQLSAGINGTKGEPGLKQGARQLANGAKELSGGASQLSGGVKQLADGIKQMSGGFPQLADGIKQLSDGAGALAENGPQLKSGINQYIEGVGQLNDGVIALSDGVDELADGARELDNGAQQLSDGLKSGASEVPSYSDSERERMTTVITRPVLTGSDTGPRLFSDPASLSAIAGIALWLGALLGAWLLGGVAQRAWRSSASTLSLALRAYGPIAGIAAGQGIVFGAIIAGLTERSGGEVAALIGIGALAGLAFAAVTVGLATLLGRIGQFIAVAVGILAIGAALVTALPAALGAVRPILPTTSAIDAFTGITGPIPGLGGNIAMLVVWLVAGVGATIWGMNRRRTVKVAAR